MSTDQQNQQEMSDFGSGSSTDVWGQTDLLKEDLRTADQQTDHACSQCGQESIEWTFGYCPACGAWKLPR
jgi:rubrerythrin